MMFAASSMVPGLSGARVPLGEALKIIRIKTKLKNKAELAEKQRLYREEHKADIAEKKRLFYQEHKAELAEKQRLFYQEHKAELAEKRRLFYQEHKDRWALVYAPRRKAKIAGVA